MKNSVHIALQDLFSDTLVARLITLRKDLHAHPELAFEEERTATKLHEAMKEISPAELDRVAGTAVVARIKGKSKDVPLVAIRGDIDALPIIENTGLDYSSTNQGVMHACGHDVHATWTVGAADLLAQNPPEGDVLIVLQPAEEIGLGAEAVLKTGVLDDVEAIFGAHVDRRFAVGEVVADEGPVAASADTFDIRLIGTGAHGARPHEAADPIVGMGALIQALQTVVSRRVNPANPAVLTIGKVHGGTAKNVIPDEVHLAGTLRATDPATRRLLHDDVTRISQSVAETHRLKAEVTLDWNCAPIVNPPDTTAWTRQATASLLGEDALVPLGFLNLGGEDFSFYMERMPGCFFRIGAREEGSEVIPAHSPKFYAAEEAIFIGAAVLAESARVASAALA